MWRWLERLSFATFACLTTTLLPVHTRTARTLRYPCISPVPILGKSVLPSNPYLLHSLDLLLPLHMHMMYTSTGYGPPESLYLLRCAHMHMMYTSLFSFVFLLVSIHTLGNHREGGFDINLVIIK
jgi:hypothetical protein